jgi:hypothetical protein
MKANRSLGCGGLIFSIQKISVLIFVLTMTACASYGGRGLQPGVANVSDVITSMGEPAMRWRDADGSQQLAYPEALREFTPTWHFLGRTSALPELKTCLKCVPLPGFCRGNTIRPTSCACSAPQILPGPCISRRVTNWPGNGCSAATGISRHDLVCYSTQHPAWCGQLISKQIFVGLEASRPCAVIDGQGVSC